MADPTKKIKEMQTEDALPQAPPVMPATTPQEAEVRAIQNVQTQQFKTARMGQPTAVLPFGQRVDATKFVKARYRNSSMAAVLSNPESILTEEWLRDHQGWKYEWPVKGKGDTTAYINAERYTPVPFTAIDKTNHHAMVQPSAEGHTVWMQHMLVAVHPSVHYEEKQAPVEDYLGRMAMNRRVVEEELNANFGDAGYRASYEVTDRRDER